MNDLIRFTWEGVTYEAPMAFYNTCMVQLPDGRVLRASGFLESMPPQPAGLVLVDIPKAEPA